MPGSLPTAGLSSDEDATIRVMSSYKTRRPSLGLNRFRSAAKSDRQRGRPSRATASNTNRTRQRPTKPSEMSSSAGVATPEREFRPRRTHKKSRLGCLQCKQARRKCDELKPSCTRCTSKNASCQYPGPSVSSPQSETSFDAPADFGDEDFWSQIQDLTIPCISMRSPSEEGQPPRPGSTGALSSPYSRNPSPLSAGLSPADFVAHPDLVLEPRESELLSHYLSHTARKFAFDTDDLYALQIGCPSLAFRSRLLMRSVLALAAVCKCHDLLDQVDRSPSALDEARELLGLADRYHSDSLSQTQTEIASVSVSYYEFVLANAPLMTLCGLASQSIRICLTRRLVASGRGFQIPPELVPAPSQWLFLIRAAHEAFSGMLLTGSSTVAASPAASLSPPSLGLGGTPNAGLISYDGNGKGQSKHLLLPILCATAGSALANLRNSVQGLHLSLGLSSSTTPFMAADGSRSPQQAQLQACVAALDVLGDIAAKVCLGDTMTAQPAGSIFGGGLLEDANLYQRRPSFDVSPWLQDYLARVTSSSPPVAFHRIITSFVNRVPSAFLSMVQDVLNQIPMQAAASSPAPSPVGGEEQGFPELDPVHRLAMEIFAHWLVFAILMDGIWWVGDLGVWELRRVLALMRNQDGFKVDGTKWWPESMYRIRTEVGKHTD